MSTLVQAKTSPIHLMRPGRNVVARTYCGVDPYRKGVRTEGINAGVAKASCPHCLKMSKGNREAGHSRPAH